MSPPFSIAAESAASEADAGVEEQKISNENEDGERAERRARRQHEQGILIGLPVVSARQGLGRKVPPTSLAPWIKLSLTLDGRDKITKVLQYSARLLAYLYRGNPALQSKFTALKASLTTSRKAYRLGRSITELEKLRNMKSLWCLLLLDFGKTDRSNVVNQEQPWWKTLGMAIKTAGLLGFWLGDNINFLAMSGLFDNNAQQIPLRLQQRKALQTRASQFGNRSYFIGGIAGLLVNLRSYLVHRRTEMKVAVERAAAASAISSGSVGDCEPTKATKEAQELLVQAQRKQFSLVVMLLKSCCDVMVFSNNPGIDLHLKYRGRKNNELLHCICGLVSASSVLYNNYPNK
uniref:Uncharacterized protein n=1 Tax=Grammatophora oceanica TaxID=210454 RepID=A0A7S1UMR9_9STRA|mmetsp:Transcript_13116/g.19336  ORF Transcript_13116/g.19336 Transcript_13116/m.19336 type:complete len:348 (+) Transcript_13116:107-1150(+)|eukprot:CAMPEP_0194049092 /NCGR_PEP_ID=MMETSP0009_2-20130614/29629_1 /TAXON_ID=210454 /ORGANISM="Grammatophora oceanica, Strain CCMP 410" /LENGTH=347 /DNA_ID=CAMNT_0038695161 /DNA_START=48 /DNA_END=1091 /DNA_ORIENTATION=-